MLGNLSGFVLVRPKMERPNAAHPARLDDQRVCRRCLFVDLLRGESRANKSKFATAIYDLGLPSRKIAFQ